MSNAAIPVPGTRVTDAKGRHAQIASIHAAAHEINALLRLEQGQEVMLPVSVLDLQTDGTYRVPLEFEQLPTDAGKRQTAIPVLREELEIGKRTVDTGRGVRVHKAVAEREQVVDLPLMHDELVIEHVPAGHLVNASDVPVARYDGATLVVPILEEVLVVQKQLRLKEEVRITRRQHEVHAPHTVALREEQVSIEHFDERSQPGNADKSS